MRIRSIALIAALAISVPMMGQSLHPKLKSKEKVIHSFAVVPPKVSVSGKDAEGKYGERHAESIADQLQESLTKVFKDSGREVKEDALGKEALKDQAGQDALASAQAAYDAISSQLQARPKDVAKGTFTLGEQVKKLGSVASVDALVFTRAHADLDSDVSASSGPNSFSFTITPKNKVRSWFSIVDAKTGEVLYVFEAKGKGNDSKVAQEVEAGIASALRMLPQ